MKRRVHQEHQYGCQVATLAILLDITYQEALTYYPCNPDSCKGFPYFTLETILVEQGYALAKKTRVRSGFNNEERSVWPPKPFGRIHWCQVETPQGVHAIVMLEDGRVLDPWTDERTTIYHPDYLKVNAVIAITPIQDW